MKLINSVKEKIYAPLGSTVLHYMRCIGVPVLDGSIIDLAISQYRNHVDENYPRLLSMLKQENSADLPKVIKDLDYLKQLFDETFVTNPSSTRAGAVYNLLKANQRFTISQLRSSMQYLETINLTKVRTMPKYFMDLISSGSSRKESQGVVSRQVNQADLPIKIKKLTESTLTEKLVLLDGTTIYVTGPERENLNGVFIYNNMVDLKIQLLETQKSITRSRVSKETKKLNAMIIAELIKRNKLKALDVVVLPGVVNGSLLRGQLTVKYPLNGKVMQDTLKPANIVFSHEGLKIYRANAGIQTPLGKREVYISYYDI